MPEVSFHIQASQYAQFEQALTHYHRLEQVRASTDFSSYKAKEIRVISKDLFPHSANNLIGEVYAITLAYEEPIQLLFVGAAMGAWHVGVGFLVPAESLLKGGVPDA